VVDGYFPARAFLIPPFGGMPTSLPFLGYLLLFN